MWIVILAVAAVLVAALLCFAATRPDTFRVERTVAMRASPATIFPLINDFHSWSSWSPYERLDPAMKKTFSGAASGKGAVYEWEGNSKAGKGRMEILDSSAPSKVTIKLDFFKPMEGHNTAEFALEIQGDSTRVTWAVYGPNVFIAKVMSVFVSMDSLLGKEFAKGLANLKALTEK
jgi:hypothetical protein